MKSRILQTAWRPWRHWRTRPLGHAAWVGVALAMLFWWQAQLDRERTLQLHCERLEALAVALAANVEAALRDGASSLRATGLAVQTEGGMLQVTPLRLEQLLRRQLTNAPTVDGVPLHAMWAVDSNARVLASSTGLDVRPVAVADRDYFRYHRDRIDSNLLLSPLFTSRLGGQPVIALTQRVDDESGAFHGILGVSLRARYLDQLYQSLRLGPSSAVTLLRADGELLFRFPFAPHQSEVRAADLPKLNMLLTQPHGSFQTEHSPYDGMARVVGFHRSTHFPLVIAVSETQDAVLAQWRRNTAIYAVLTLAVYLLVAWLFRLALARGRQLDSANQRALQDPLTGLPNRRMLEQLLPVEWGRAARSSQPFALLFIDIDHFKKYNDHYGHQQGDQCLRMVAQCMQGMLRRPGDMMARYGGEEFVCLLPGTDMSGARQRAQDLLDAVTKLLLPHATSPTAPVVTLSIGLASASPGDGSTARALLGRADQALYCAKEQGRNRFAEASLAPGCEAVTPT